MRGMNRGRPRNFDPDLVLENAMQLFWSKGYEATSLQDLLEATRLSKSSLYESFGNKQSLFEAAFSRYVESRVSYLLERLELAASPLAFIRECLLAVLDDAERATPRGCMLVNVANEFSTSDPAVQRLIALATRRFRGVFEQAFQQARAAGEVSAAQQPAARALYMHCVMSGLRTQTKAGMAQQELRTVIELFMASVS
jgi:AcrR family transcriptional regulator